MRFLVDAQLPPSLALELQARGHKAEHVNDIGFAAAVGSAIWDYAVAVGAVIVTKDEDFAFLARREPSTGASVVWVRLGNSTNRGLHAALEPIFDDLFEALARGEKLIEITT